MNETTWRITAGRGGVLTEDWLEEKIITVGWDIGNIEEMEEEEIREKSRDSQMTKFVGAREEGDGMREGDLVIAYAPGRKLVVGVGEVDSKCYYEDDHDLPIDHPYRRDVKWEDLGAPVKKNDLPKDLQQFGGENWVWHTSTLEEFYGDIERVIRAIEKAPRVKSVKQSIFSPDSEEQIQKYIYQNIKELGDLENPKMEVSTGVGKIDILAEKRGEEGIVAIEVKKGTAGDSAVGQILGYVNALQQTEQSVEGILVAEGFKPRTKTALKGKNIQTVEVNMKLAFEIA